MGKDIVTDIIPIFHGQICCYRHYYTNIPWTKILLKILFRTFYQYSMDKKNKKKKVWKDIYCTRHYTNIPLAKIMFQTFYQYSMDKDIVPYIIPLVHGQRYCSIYHTTITWAKILFHTSYQYYMGNDIVPVALNSNNMVPQFASIAHP